MPEVLRLVDDDSQRHQALADAQAALERMRERNRERNRRKERCDWRLELVDPLVAGGAPREVLRVARALAAWQRTKTGYFKRGAYVLMATHQLASTSGVGDRRNVQRAIRWLEASGRISVDRTTGGRLNAREGRANTYWLLDAQAGDVVRDTLADLT